MSQSKFNDILTIGLQNVVETLTYYHTFCPSDRYFTISLFYKLFSSFLFSKNFSPQKVTKKVQRNLTANLFYFSVTEICLQGSPLPLSLKALFNAETRQWPTFQQAQISLIWIFNVSTFTSFRNNDFIWQRDHALFFDTWIYHEQKLRLTNLKSHSNFRTFLIRQNFKFSSCVFEWFQLITENTYWLG